MKPFTSGTFLAAWLLRILLIWFIYQHYFESIMHPEFRSFSFYLGTAYVVFGILLLVGGFMQRPTLTVIAGLAIFILPIIQLIKSFPSDIRGTLLFYLIPLAVGFYFFTGGNNN